MPYINLLCEIKEGIATVTVNRPKALNALNAETVAELDDVFTDLRDDANARAVILIGAGDRAFVSGADIKELSALTTVEAKEYINRGQAVLEKIENLGKPTLAAINGYALGGGLELAMACTLRVASEKARLGQPEVMLGIIPGYGGTQRLPRLVGRAKAMEMILTGDMIDAAEALQLGLVNKVVPPEELIPEAEKLLKTILSRGPLAVAYALEAINKGLDMPLAEAIAFEGNLISVLFSSADRTEGCRAFLEKRNPEFKGK